MLQNYGSYPVRDGAPRGAAVAEVLEAQARAGIDIVTDGQVGWPDPLSHFMAALGGVQLGGARPYFDTPIHYRQPVITAALVHRAPILRDGFVLAAALTRHPLKAVVPGPYTLAQLSHIDCSAYRDAAALADRLGEIVTAEVAALVAAGAKYVQIEEPAILRHPQDIRLLRRLLEPMWDARGEAQLILATNFADAAPLYAELNSLPADILAVDIPTSPGLVDLISATGASKVLALGVLDGLNADLEEPALVARSIERMLRRYAQDSLHLQPSCGLAQLSPDGARAKLAMLSAVRAQLRPGG